MMILQVTHQVFIVILVLLKESINILWHYTIHPILSNLIETPKTNKSHTIFGQLPTQTVHLATPVPSPTLAASDYMSGGENS